YRQLSDKSLKAWKVERWMIHSVLVFAVVMTAGVLYTYFTGSGTFLFIDTYTLRATYGFLIGAAFAGVVGVGFYPIMGNRVWCRFGCPLAAYIGIVQRFKSRFRITTNGGQCISCGNCSTYCEMGIDVRWYAQRGQNIVRSSCVGCGVCASVCPRGVLKLENGEEEGRFGKPILIGNNSVQVFSDIDYIR
ncbi:4Fe-4S binding protein, partial [Pontibacter pamirensis]|uniref:4Fe-4S binding protein n=1 Tax=Pontibacter pamirensis TaxID=2562824 RepID=UPI00192E35EA